MIFGRRKQKQHHRGEIMKIILIVILVFVTFNCSRKVIIEQPKEIIGKQNNEKIIINENKIKAEELIKQAEDLYSEDFSDLYLVFAKDSYEKGDYLDAINFAEAAIDKANKKDNNLIIIEYKEKSNKSLKINELIYVVKNGDSLWSIACEFYENSFKWKLICEKNKLENCNLIYPCQKLIIPMEE
jgi:hypothetical protein